jgi:hypothetical protein
MIDGNFYSIFYVGIMAVLAVINGIQLGASKGYPFRRFANVLQVAIFMIVPVAFVLGGQTSGFFFWTILAFAASVALDAVELTLISCGKIKPKDAVKEPETPPIQPPDNKRGHLRAKEIRTKDSVASHYFTVVVSFALNFAVFFVSVMLVTGYFFQ